MATVKRCERALEEHEDRLGALPNVTGLGIVRADEGDSTGKGLAVAVYVTHKIPVNQLGEDQVIPKRLVYRDRGRTRWVPVRVIEQGPVSLEPGPAGSGTARDTEPVGKEPLGSELLGKEPL